MVKRGGERVTLRRHPEAEVTSSPTCSSHFYLALQPPVCPPHLGHWPACSLVLCPGRQLVCLKPTQRHRHAHTETQRWKEREGGYEGHIHRPWNRPGLVQVRASLPGHLSNMSFPRKWCQGIHIADDMGNDTPPKLCVQHICIPTALATGTVLKNILHLIQLNSHYSKLQQTLLYHL